MSSRANVIFCIGEMQVLNRVSNTSSSLEINYFGGIFTRFG